MAVCILLIFQQAEAKCPEDGVTLLSNSAGDYRHGVMLVRPPGKMSQERGWEIARGTAHVPGGFKSQVMETGNNLQVVQYLCNILKELSHIYF